MAGGSQAIGFIFAIISATMNGSFTSVSKIKRVADADLDPIIFVSLWSTTYPCASPLTHHV